MKSLFLLVFILLAPSLRSEDNVVKLTSFPITEMFDSFLPSFGEYRSIDTVVASQQWSGAVRLVCQRQIGYGSVAERYFAVFLYKIPEASTNASARASILIWRDGDEMPRPKELTGSDAAEILRRIDESEFFSLPSAIEMRGLKARTGEWDVMAEEYRPERAVRVFRNIENSCPARALLEALDIRTVTTKKP